MLASRMRMATGGYRPGGVRFGGTDEFLSMTGAWTGAVVSKVGTLSMWVRKMGGDGAIRYLMARSSLSTYACEITTTAANKVRFTFQNTGGSSDGLDMVSSTSLTVDGQWHHIAASWDNETTTRQLYFDGVADTPTVTWQNNTASGWASEMQIGARAGANMAQVDLCDVWLTMLERIDLSSGVTKFRTLRGRPVYLGESGERPTTTSPVLFLRRKNGAAASTFADNLGTGDGMTENGTLVAVAGPAG